MIEIMKKVLICAQKGGVGKSTISDELAFSFERSGIPMAFLDLDVQGGTIHKTNRDESAEVAVIDTPGMLSPQLGEWLAEADVIVVPMRTTSRDIEPLWRMKTAVEAAGKSDRVIYVINGWTRFKASADFLPWFRGACGEDVPLFRLPQSEMFVQAGAAGRSVVGYGRKRTPAGEAVLELCDAVREMVGFAPEDR